MTVTLAACCLAPRVNSRLAALPFLPCFSLTGNSCPASSRRPCQHPPLEYFRGKSENDQLPPNLFFHRPYMGILGCSGLFAFLPLAIYKKRCKYTAAGGTPRKCTATLTHLPLPLPLSCHTGTWQPSQAHSRTHTWLYTCSVVSSQPSLPLRTPHLAQSSCSHIIELHFHRSTRDR